MFPALANIGEQIVGRLAHIENTCNTMMVSLQQIEAQVFAMTNMVNTSRTCFHVMENQVASLATQDNSMNILINRLAERVAASETRLAMLAAQSGNGYRQSGMIDRKSMQSEKVGGDKDPAWRTWPRAVLGLG